MNDNKISSIELGSLEMPEYMIAALLRSYLSHMEENVALKKLSEIVKPKVIGVYAVHTATPARALCHTLPLTAHGQCPAEKEPA